MLSFVSTRGSAPTTFAEALVQGLAEDGGLYVPEVAPRLLSGGPEAAAPGAASNPAPGGTPALAGSRRAPATRFADSARWAAQGLLADALPPDLIPSIVDSALDFEAPLVEVEDGLYVMELFHGPSLAFKDVGARFMARAMAAVGGAADRTVLVATSGDTGGAVASAFHGVAGTRVVVLFPRDGISARQRRQMTTLAGNIVAVGVDGTFDDCQRMAKAAFADEELRTLTRLTSANSINVGRLIPQSFYYVHAAALLGWHGSPPTFVVPSGNLGNLCAGLLAHRAGLPAAGFVAACNANRVFLDYLEDGRLERRPSLPTVSNAMDVGDPSNLERIRWLYDDDVGALRADVTGISSDDEETRSTIADVFQRTGYVLDPHGAVAYCAARKAALPGEGPAVILATAHPAKFPDVVEEATRRPVPLPPALAARMHEPEHWVEIDPSDADLRRLLLNEHAT
jgi:threonine synthase